MPLAARPGRRSPEDDPEARRPAAHAFATHARVGALEVSMNRIVVCLSLSAVMPVVSMGCGEEGAEQRLLVSAARFADPAEGRLAVVDLQTGEVEVASDPSPDVDTVVDRAEGVPLALSRTGGMVRVQSERDPLHTVRTIDVNPPGLSGESFVSNPQRVIGVGGGRAYVVARARNELVIIDPRSDGASEPLGTIDLEPLMAPGDTDGVVDAADGLRHGNRVYVTLARSWFDLMTFSFQYEGSVIAVVDTASDTLVDADPSAEGVQGIALEANISGGGLVRDGNLLYVVATGAYGAWDGGIEVVDLDRLESRGLALKEADLERDVAGLAWVSPTRAYVMLAALFDESLTQVAPSSLRVWNPSTGELADEDFATGASGAFVHDGVLYLRTGGSLLRFDAETGEDLGAIVVTELPLANAVPVR
jgi:hypothetical protein